MVDSNKDLQSRKNSIIEQQHIFKKPVWNPGSPCVVYSLFSSDKCPKYQEGCACTDTTCKHIAQNNEYFETLKEHEQNQENYNQRLAVAKQAWKQFVRS